MQRQLLTIMLWLAPVLLQAAEIEGVKLADKVRVVDAGPELVLNGAGVRTRLVFKVYVGALYLQQKHTAPEVIFSDSAHKRVALHLLRDVSAEQLFSALNDGLKSNHTSDQLAKIDSQTHEFEAIFKKLQSVKAGDVIVLDYIPGAGTRVTVNGAAKGVMAGDEFYTALLRIWLGEKPAEDSLKKALLGG